MKDSYRPIFQNRFASGFMNPSYRPNLLKLGESGVMNPSYQPKLTKPGQFRRYEEFSSPRSQKQSSRQYKSDPITRS